ncbi:unnamed protein product [Cuscuta campestris]|uniref:Uncharacterized protein n=1 Tax=Cuscuta campestris TaxID=132261 RepID=A0A484L3H1_9ASTE|nr:unnamed protein product [Cuscuta campestris]
MNGKPNTVKVIDDDQYKVSRCEDKVVDEEFPKVDNSILMDTLKLFDLDDTKKFEYLAPLRVVRHLFGFASNVLRYASNVMIFNDGSPGWRSSLVQLFPFCPETRVETSTLRTRTPISPPSFLGARKRSKFSIFLYIFFLELEERSKFFPI